MEVFLQFFLAFLAIGNNWLLVPAVVICPPAETYSPCTCYEYSNIPDTIYLYCGEKNLDDLKVSQILDAFLTTPGVSTLGNLCLIGNRLTRVPSQVHLFPQLDYVWLNDNNISSSIQSGAFTFNKETPVRNLDLQFNQLITIAPGAFQGVGFNDMSAIALTHNNLTRFESVVFQSILEKMVPTSPYPAAYIHIYNSIMCIVHLFLTQINLISFF